MIVTLVPLGAVTASVAIGAISIWTDDDAAPPRDSADAVLLTLLALYLCMIFLTTAIGGVVRVRQQRADERRLRESQRIRAVTASGKDP